MSILAAIAVIASCSVLIDACKVSQLHVTLGDMFEVDSASDHAFTLSAVFEGCDEFPRYFIDCQSDKMMVVEDIIAKAIDIDIGGTRYARRSIHAKIAADKVNCKWQIRYNGLLVAGPYDLPARVLDDSKPLTIAIVADMDLTIYSSATVGRLMQLNVDDIDIVMHVGDFAYEIEDDGGNNGDAFFEQMSKKTRMIPYIVTPGNHENFAGGELFNYRFRMPNTGNDPVSEGQNHYYEFFVKGVYFISLNFDYILVLKPDKFKESLTWIEEKLKAVQNNKNIKWKVFFSHRPIICNDLQFTLDCSFNMFRLKAFDDLFIKYNITVVLNAHLHIYSRLRPYHDWQPRSIDSVGRGSYMQLISGHAGTKHYFPDNSTAYMYEYPFVEKVDLSGPTYMTWQVTRKRLQGQLRLSKDDSILDEFSFVSPASRRYPAWLFPVIITVAVVFFLAVVWMMVYFLKHMKKEDERLQQELETRLMPESRMQSVGVCNLENELAS